MHHFFFLLFQVLCLIGRALNIYPLSYVVNHFREHKITKKMMFIMWFSGTCFIFCFDFQTALSVNFVFYYLFFLPIYTSLMFSRFEGCYIVCFSFAFRIRRWKKACYSYYNINNCAVYNSHSWRINNASDEGLFLFPFVCMFFQA